MDDSNKKQMAVRTGEDRREAYRKQAEKDGTTLSKWVVWNLDALLPKSVRKKLPQIRDQGRPKQ